MNIKDAEKLTGVSSRNIRFYEQKGLLTPARNEGNDYREYADEEIHRLKLIRALRMVDMPLEQIKLVLNEELSLQDAAAQQKQRITEKIKHLETAARFCDALSDPEQELEEILARMDEPKNRKLLSKRWNLDYTELAKKILLPLGAGLLPAAWGYGLFWALFLLLFIPKRIALIGALVFPFVWLLLGYGFGTRGSWLRGFLLAHILPIVVYIVCAHVENLRFLDYYRMPMSTLQSILTGNKQFYFAEEDNLFGLVVYLVCFCAGGLIAKLVCMLRARLPKKQEDDTGSFKALIIRTISLLTVLVIIIVFSICGPVGETVRPQMLETWMIGTDQNPGDTLRIEQVLSDGGDSKHEVLRCKELAEVFQFEKWERVFNLPNNNLQCRVIMNGGWKRGPVYFMEIYADGYVHVHHDLEVGQEDAYYRIPPRILEDLLTYANDHGL